MYVCNPCHTLLSSFFVFGAFMPSMGPATSFACDFDGTKSFLTSEKKEKNIHSASEAGLWSKVRIIIFCAHLGWRMVLCEKLSSARSLASLTRLSCTVSCFVETIQNKLGSSLARRVGFLLSSIWQPLKLRTRRMIYKKRFSNEISKYVPRLVHT